MTFSIKNTVWDMPYLPPLPSKVNGRSACKTITNRTHGEWQFLPRPISDIPSPYAENQDYDFSKIAEVDWKECIVPASLVMQGFDIQNNDEYYYRYNTKLEYYAGERTILRFEGVYCNARVWVNGRFLSAHIGGFTPFDVDITQFAGEEITLTVGVADIEGTSKGLWNPAGEMMSDASWASYYAHHNICGILRDAVIYNLPESGYILHRELKCRLDGVCELKSGLLVAGQGVNISHSLIYGEERVAENKATAEQSHSNPYITAHNIDFDKYKASAEVKARDKKFSEKHLRSRSPEVTGEICCVEISSSVPHAKLWTAETPYLYEQKFILTSGNNIVEYSFKVGLRSIERKGNKVYVNGKEIKLRGVCRHDVSWEYGRSMSMEQAYAEINAYKRNNVNFIRTSHYPPGKYIMEACDELGVYVEVENSVCFKGGNGYGVHCAAEEILTTMAETYGYYNTYPSNIIWSIGNESGFESNLGFRAAYEYLIEKDSERPIIFSYPHTVKTEPKPYHIYSKHYAKVYGKLGIKDMPKLHDEFAHVNCYNIKDIKHDNVNRLIWGRSIKRGWDNILNTDGALGCAIWAATDDIFAIPRNISVRHQNHGEGRETGFGPWGSVLDQYQREKPEAYMTKKAFSPVRVKNMCKEGNTAILSVYNGFDHISLSEVSAVIFDGKGMERRAVLPDIAPHSLGEIRLEIGGEYAEIAFMHRGIEVEREALTADADIVSKVACGEKLSLGADKANRAVVYGGGKPLIILANTVYNGKEKQGAFIIRENTDGKLKLMHKNGFLLKTYYSLSVENDNTVKVSCRPSLLTRIIFGREIGSRWITPGDIERVEWRRKAEFSVYPDGHIGRSVGVAYADNYSRNRYGEKPADNWEKDVYNYFFEDNPEGNSLPVSNDFKTSRMNIREYSAISSDRTRVTISSEKDGVNALASKKIARQAITCEDSAVKESGRWTRYSGGLFGTYHVSRKAGSRMNVNFEGEGIRIYGTRSKKQGVINIYIDGELKQKLNTRSDICDVLDFAVLASFEGLAAGKHELAIELLDNDGLRIGGFEALDKANDTAQSSIYVYTGKDERSIGWGNERGKLLGLRKRKLEYTIAGDSHDSADK